MKHRFSDEDATTQKIKLENEIRTNKRVSVLMLNFVVFPIINLALMEFDYSEILSQISLKFFLPLSCGILPVFVAEYLCHFRAPWIKYLLIILLIMLCGTYYFFFSGYCGMLITAPVLAASRYYNQRFTKVIASVSLAVFVLLCVLGMILEKTSDYFQIVHAAAFYNPWVQARDTLSFVIFPISLFSAFFGFYAVGISGSGHRLIRAQAENLNRISAVETELSMASRVQMDALPSCDYSAPGGEFSLFAGLESAREVGGDFYDYMLLRDHLMMFLIADVSDKGFPAAMFMMSAKKAIRCALSCTQTLEDAIALASRLICEDNQGGMFLTVWLGLYDTQSGVCRYINAGHLPPFLKRADGSIERICNDPDLFLGCFAEMVPKVYSFRMREGDTLLLFTDGVTDSMNSREEAFGEERLRKVLENASGEASALRDEVIAASKSFAGNAAQFDDRTLLLLHCDKLEESVPFSMEGPAEVESITAMQDGLQQKLSDSKVPEKTRNKIGVIADEMLGNFFLHGYEGEKGMMRLEASVCGRCCDLRFVNNGIPFDPFSRKNELHDVPQIGGYGIYLVRSLSNEVSYEFANGQNIVSVRVLWDF